jgi:hypothetical protein
LKTESEIRAELERQETERAKPAPRDAAFFCGPGIGDSGHVYWDIGMIRALRWALGEREEI